MEAVNESNTTINKIYLDGKEITLMELQEARKKPNVKIKLVEGTTNQYKTLERLQG